MFNKVSVLAEGYSSTIESPDSSNYMLANCSCTLIQTTSGSNIIVDTMTAWDGQYILSALERFGLQPQDVDYVVCTHGHSDHIGCNYLFLNAKWHFVGTCMSNANKYPEINFEEPFELDNDNVKIMYTPGHTSSCVSVLVYNTEPNGGVIGICGDLFEREDDIFNEDIWLNAGSENPKAQRENRSRIAELCSRIIPGHGKEFDVTDEIRRKLRIDLAAK